MVTLSRLHWHKATGRSLSCCSVEAPMSILKEAPTTMRSRLHPKVATPRSSSCCSAGAPTHCSIISTSSPPTTVAGAFSIYEWTTAALKYYLLSNIAALYAISRNRSNEFILLPFMHMTGEDVY